MKKGKMFFNIIIIISFTILISFIGYIIYNYIGNYLNVKEAEEAVQKFENEVIVVSIDEEENNNEEQIQKPVEENKTSNNTSKITYKSYSMVGTIQIPKTKVKAPIVDKVTVNSISAAVGILYGQGLNNVGNTVLVAHNYRNGTFFSNNKKLAVGDKIYITDLTGKKVEYSVYKTYVTDEMDFSYATRETNRKKGNFAIYMY